MYALTHEVWALIGKARHLETLSRRCTFYERHEILDRQGTVVERHSRGVPFVHRKGLGSVPVDPELPHLDDGSVVSQVMFGYTDDKGRWHRVVQYRRLPGASPPTPRSAAPKPTSKGKGDIEEILRRPGELIPVFVHLRDREELPRLPARALGGLDPAGPPAGTADNSKGGFSYDGIDVISSSASENSDYLITPDGADFVCPSPDQARGLDTSSMAIVYAFQQENILFTKAAGNENTTTEMVDCGTEIAAPGASAAVISSGALKSVSTSGAPMTAARLQREEILRSDSDGGITADGRTYPSLVVVTDQCGCATPYQTQRQPGHAIYKKFWYESQGQTSGTAPRIAGSALLFKHWYVA